MTRRSPMLAVVGILAFLMPIPGELGAGRNVADFSGAWQLNEELSEDPGSIMRESMESRGGGGMGRGGGGMGRGGGGMGRGGGGMGRGSGMGDPQAMRDRMRRMEHGNDTLTILHVESEMTIRTADDRERLIQTDGRKHARTGGVGPVETQAKWKKGRLIVRDRMETGMTVTRTFFYLPEDPHLYVDTEIGGRGRSFRFRRVYDRTD